MHTFKLHKVEKLKKSPFRFQPCTLPRRGAFECSDNWDSLDCRWWPKPLDGNERNRSMSRLQE